MNKKKLAASIKRSRKKQLKKMDQKIDAGLENLIAMIDALPLDEDEDDDASGEEQAVFDPRTQNTVIASPLFWEMFDQEEVFAQLPKDGG